LLTIDEGQGWKEIRNITLAGYPGKLTCTKYYHPESGASLSIAPIPLSDSAEIYVKTRLNNITSGKNKLRFSDKVEKGKYFFKYFEVSSDESKYLIILEASKYTYDKYKVMYENIINSAGIKN